MSDFEKMKFESKDLTAENREKLAQLFPGVVVDGKVNVDLLRSFVGEEIFKDEAYEFTWVGKRESIAEAGRPIRRTLRPCPDESRNWDTTENLYIEGDNLEVLKLLQESYLGKVKMIYIDPPYNTGNDFVYRDNFSVSRAEYEEESGVFDEEGQRLFKNTETNGRFHSDWCSMIYPRLVLARNLLREDGVILLNIDEHEIVNLQKICNEVFGESNELGVIVWDKRNPKGDARGISYQHEYIVCFAVNEIAFLENGKLQRPKKNAKVMLNRAENFYSKISSSYTFEQANSDYASWVSQQREFSGGEKAYNKFDDKGRVFRTVSMAWPNNKRAPADYWIPLIHPITQKDCPVPAKGWRNPSITMQRLIGDNEIIFGEDESTQPQRKYLLKDNMYEKLPSLLYYGGSDTELLKKMDIPFDTPKAMDVVKEHLQAMTGETDIILDFFSGSATTAHAVMQLNAEDGGNRKFIMVQLPEACAEGTEAKKAGYKNICEIGKERIRRAGDMILSENKTQESEEGLFDEKDEKKAPLDIGFRVLKVDDSNMNDIYYPASETTIDVLNHSENNIKDDRTDMDLLFGCLLDWCLPLNMPHTHEDMQGVRIHIYNHGDLIACFAEKISEGVIREIAKRQPLRVVFRDSSFEDSANKINVTEIFKLLAPGTKVKVI